MQKRNADMTILRDVIQRLVTDGTLPQKFRPHKLTGNWHNVWECHLKGDWLLIYEISESELWLARTGTHSDLFG